MTLLDVVETLRAHSVSVTDMSGRRQLAATYLLVQAAAVPLWWLALALSPRVRGWFEVDTERHDVLSAFVVGDLVILLAGSIASAVGLLREADWATRSVAWVAGGSAYATLYLAAWVALGGHGAAGLAPMVGATLATSVIALRYARE
jgi:hypothetical protein